MLEKKILFTVLIMFCLKTATSQAYFDKYSIGTKGGIYNWTEDNGGIIAGGELNASKNTIMYSIDYYHYSELNIWTNYKSQYYNQIGLMIGKYFGEKHFRFQMQGGVAPFWGLKRTELTKDLSAQLNERYSYDRFFNAGLVGKLGFKLIVTTFCAVGIDFQVNVNHKASVYMPMFSIEYGKIKDRLY